MGGEGCLEEWKIKVKLIIKNLFDKMLVLRLFSIGLNMIIFGIIGWLYWGRNWLNFILIEEKKIFLKFVIWENIVGLKN